MHQKLKRRGAIVAVALGAALALAGCSTPSEPVVDPTPTAGGGELEALIADAKAEGTVSVYSVMDERLVQQLQSAFKEEYGIELTYLRATAAEIAQRFSAEAEANAPVADIVLNLNDGSIQDALKNDLMTPLEDADIPGFPNGLAPAAVLDGTAMVQITQLGIGFNVDNAKGITDWEDLLDPKLKGKIALPSPENGIYNSLFYELSQEYGDDFLVDLGGQVGRVYTSGSQILESLSSGEAWATPAALPAAIAIAQSQGAPVDAVIPTQSMKSATLLAINADAPHPAAARLLAYYLTTPEGLAMSNDGPGLIAPTSDDVLEGGWVFTPELAAEAAKHSEEVAKALGL